MDVISVLKEEPAAVKKDVPAPSIPAGKPQEVPKKGTFPHLMVHLLFSLASCLCLLNFCCICCVCPTAATWIICECRCHCEMCSIYVTLQIFS